MGRIEENGVFDVCYISISYNREPAKQENEWMMIMLPAHIGGQRPEDLPSLTIKVPTYSTLWPLKA